MASTTPSKPPQSFNAFNNTTSSLLDDLLENSRKLRQDTRLPDLPSLQLGLGEIERRARNLNASGSVRQSDARAHYLLQATGVKTDEALKELDSIDVGFDDTPAQTVTARAAGSDADVEHYLRSRKEQNIMSAIEEGIRRTTQEFETHVANNINLDWDAQKKRIYEHFGLASKTAGAGIGDPQITGRSTFGSSSFGRSSVRGNTVDPMGQSSFGRSGYGRSPFVKSSLGSAVLGVPPKQGNPSLLFSDTDKSNQGSPMDQMYGRQQGYLNVIKRFNHARLEKKEFPLATAFSEVTKSTQDIVTSQIYEAWKMLACIIGPEAENSRRAEGYFADAYSQKSDDSAAGKLREHIERGARSYLEAQFFQTVEDTINRNPAEAKVGGVPTVENKIKAYVNIKLMTKDKWKDTNFEMVNRFPGWAVVFYLLRAGYVAEAAKYVEENAETFAKLERNFILYIQAYKDSPDRSPVRNLLDRLHAEWNQRIKFQGEGTDPYKQAVYKIIGRCELPKRTIPDILVSAEDWMWLQLVLTREVESRMVNAQEVYTCEDLKKSVIQFGGKHFGLANSNFGLYFQMLLMAGLFEKAVHYLYSFLYVDAVHFAVALRYYGLLNIAEENGDHTVNLLTVTETKNQKGNKVDLYKINFARAVGYYTQDFRRTNTVEAVDYLSLICLNVNNAQGVDEQQLKLCHEALRQLVLETRDFPALLGDVRADGTREEGAVEQRSSLIKLNNKDDFLHTITNQAAIQADNEGRTSDAVLLYHLAGDYDTVVAILIKSLSEYLASSESTAEYDVHGRQPMGPGGQPLNHSMSLTAVESPVVLTRSMTTVYANNQSMYSKVSRANWEAGGVLLRIADAKQLYRQGNYEKCLQSIEALNVIPLDENGDVGTVRRMAQNFGSLHETVARNVPGLLVMSVHCANRLIQQLREANYAAGTRERKVAMYSGQAKSALIYAGMIQYKMPSDVYNQMTLLE